MLCTSHQNKIMLFETHQEFLPLGNSVAFLSTTYLGNGLVGSVPFLCATSSKNPNNPFQLESLRPRKPNPVLCSDGFTPLAINCPIATPKKMEKGGKQRLIR